MSVVLAVEVDTTSYYKPGHEAPVIYGSGMLWFPRTPKRRSHIPLAIIQFNSNT
jgi:hypothetical protein